VGGTVIYIIVHKTRFCKTQDKEGMELLTVDNSQTSKLQSFPSVPPPPTLTSQQQSDGTVEEDDYQDVGIQHSTQQQKESTIEDEEDKEDLYDEVNNPSLQQFNNFLSNAHSPPLPSGPSPPSRLLSPVSGPPAPTPLGPPLPARGPPISKEYLSMTVERQTEFKPRPQPPIRKDSVMTSQQSSVSDDRNALPPPPPPQDDLDNYDDIHNTQSEFQHDIKPPLPSGKPSFLHNTGKPTIQPATTSISAKPLGTQVDNKILQGKQWPPVQSSRPPQVQNPSSSSTFSDHEEEIYEDV